MKLMNKTRKAFGFYPEPLRIDAGPIRIEPVPKLDEVAGRVLSGDDVENDWIYAPPQGVRDLMSGQVRERPYSTRVFGLPQTHTIEHAGAEGDEHLNFLVWAPVVLSRNAADHDRSGLSRRNARQARKSR